MIIIMVRHAEALDKKIAVLKKIPDSARPLTKIGSQDFKVFLKGKKNLFKNTDALISSSLIRAIQTAKIIKNTYLKSMEIKKSSLITPLSKPQGLKRFIENSNYKKLVFVSHEPFIGNFLYELSGVQNEFFKVKKGAIIVIHYKENCYKLNLFLNP